MASAGVEIVRGPQTVPNATLGGTASFECIINSDFVLPRWSINGIGFTITHLPSGFYFENNLHSKVLTVNPVQQEMNDTCIYCYLLFYDGRIERSAQAKLIIQPPTLSYTSIQASATCVLSPDQQATAIVPSGPHSLSLVFCITSKIASTLKYSTVAPLSSSLYNKPVHTNVPSNLQNYLISKPKKVVLTQNLYDSISIVGFSTTAAVILLVIVILIVNIAVWFTSSRHKEKGM